MKQRISIILPAFNEGDSISSVIKEIKASLSNIDYDYEIIVVDDASLDSTGQIAEREGVKVIAHTQQRGYGAAVKTGIKNSDGQLVAIIDADGSYAASDLLTLIEQLKDNDMVVGARIKPGAKIDWLRKIAKLFLTLLASYLVEAKIPDLNSGLRIMKRDELMRFLNILPNKFSLTTTTTLAFLDSNLRVKFIPVDYRKRRGGKSKIRPIYDTLNFIQLIIRTVIYFNPLRIFVPLSLLFLLLGIGVFLYSRLFLAKVMDITTVILLVSSIQILSIGMIADAIIRKQNR
ncbi:MAG: glycosyltransferase family 2 protein [Candidatus Omnitrophota bacterium]